jgi:hypothetical protein
MTPLIYFGLGVWAGVLVCAALVLACAYWRDGQKRDEA